VNSRAARSHFRRSITVVRSLLLTTGGTIGYSARENRMLSGLELARAAGLHFDEIRDLRAEPSWDLKISDMEDIALVVRASIDEGYRSIVVTHGTDTMEETAWLCDLLEGHERRRDARVIFTGAMRFPDDPNSDGCANLSFAFDHAQRTLNVDQGVQIAFAGQLHAARWARKYDARELNAFTSDGRPSSSGSLPSSSGVLDHDVALVVASSVVRHEIPADAHGVVLWGTGAGHVPSSYLGQIHDLTAAGVPVVVATRVRDVLRPPGHLDEVLRAGDLTASKAVLALMCALGTSRRMSDVHQWWTELLSTSIA